MATKKSSFKPSQSVPSSFRGFINVFLTDEARQYIKSKPFDDDVFAQELFRSIQEGYKFTFSADDYNHAYQVIGTRQDKDHPDFGILLSGRGSTPVKAFKQWLYLCRDVVGDSSWSEYLTSKTPEELDD